MFKEKFLIFFLSIKFLIVIADLPSETNYQYITELEVTKTEDNYLLYEPKTISLPENCRDLFDRFKVSKDGWQIVYEGQTNKQRVYCTNSELKDGTKKRLESCSQKNECMNQNGLDCIEQKCDCPSNRFFSEAEQKCFYKKTMGEQCANKPECYAHCIEGKCACPSDMFFCEYDKMCEAKKELEAHCEYSNECFADCIEGVCACPSDKYYSVGDKKCKDPNSNSSDQSSTVNPVGSASSVSKSYQSGNGIKVVIKGNQSPEVDSPESPEVES